MCFNQENMGFKKMKKNIKGVSCLGVKTLR